MTAASPFEGNPKEEYYMVTFASDRILERLLCRNGRCRGPIRGKSDHTGAPLSDVNQQVTVLEQVIAKRPAGIAVTCSNPDGLRATIDRAIEAGIPVVTFDADSR